MKDSGPGVGKGPNKVANNMLVPVRASACRGLQDALGLKNHLRVFNEIRVSLSALPLPITSPSTHQDSSEDIGGADLRYDSPSLTTIKGILAGF